MRGPGLFIFFFLCLVLHTAAGTGEIVVSPTDDLKTMMEAAASGSKMILEAGVFHSACNISISKSISIIGKAGRNATILDCQNSSTFHFDIVGSADIEVHIQGLSLTNGKGSGYLAGCVTAYGANVTIIESEFTACRGHYGAISATRSVISMENVIFDSNSATYGGGIAAEESMVWITRSAFSRCSASSDGGSIHLDAGSKLEGWSMEIKESSATNGGAVAISTTSEAAIQHSLVQQCDATNNGGAFSVSSSVLTLSENNSFWHNSAYRGGLVYEWISDVDIRGNNDIAHHTATYGAGAYLSGGRFTTSGHCVFRHGRAAADGGAIYGIYEADIDIDHTIFEGQEASSYGGSIRLYLSHVKVRHSVVKNSWADRGGGFYLQESTLHSNQVDFYRCDAGFAGGVMYLSRSPDVTVSNSHISHCHTVYGGFVGAYSYSTINLFNSTCSDLVGTVRGGAIRARSGSKVNIEGTTFVRCNTVGTGMGGALGVVDIDLSVMNTTFEQCVSNAGGAIRLEGSSAWMEGCTFRDCFSSSSGGAVSVYSNDGFPVQVTNSVFERNEAAFEEGAIYLANSGAPGLTVYSSVFKSNRGGSMPVLNTYYSILTVKDSSFEDHHGGHSPIGVEGVSAVFQGCNFSSNSGPSGGVFYAKNGANIQVSDCIFANNFGNIAGVFGGLAKSSSTSFTSQRCVFRNNTSFQKGGAISAPDAPAYIYLFDSTFLFNSARIAGGAIHLSSNSYYYFSNTVFTSNWATYRGGALLFESEASGTLLKVEAFNNSVFPKAEDCDVGTCGGGFVSLLDRSSLTVSQSNFRECFSGTDGGAVMITGASQISFAEVVLRGNKAIKDGGGLAAYSSSEASVGSNVYFEECTAKLGRGGAIFAGGGQILFDEICQLTGNRAAMGGSIGFLSLVQFNEPMTTAGQYSVIANNSATSSIGGAFMGQGARAVLRVHEKHHLRIDSNVANTHGGAMALTAGATFNIEEEESCSEDCSPLVRNNGVCNTECFNKACNWDGSDCFHLFDSSQAAKPCCRGNCDLWGGESCNLWDENGYYPPKSEAPWWTDLSPSNPGTYPCKDACIAASCDWGGPKCRDKFPSFENCPFFDLAVYATSTHSDSPIYVQGGTAEGLGRCDSNGCQNATDTRPDGLWCKVVDDGGVVTTQVDSNWGVQTHGESYGYCSFDSDGKKKPRTPGSGFDYEPIIFQQYLQLPLVQILNQHQGCGAVAVMFSNNEARYGNGGALYQQECDDAASQLGHCFMMGLTSSAGSTVVAYESNKAGGAGGAVFTGCSDVGIACIEMMQQTMGFSPLVETRRILFSENQAGAYGPDLASAPNAMEAFHDETRELIPGQSLINISFRLYDAFGQPVRGSNSVPNPYLVSIQVCSQDASSCSTSDTLQPLEFFKLEPQSSISSTLRNQIVLQNCKEKDSRVVFYSYLTGDAFSEVPGLRTSTFSPCGACIPGTAAQNTAIVGAMDEINVVSCKSCEANEYVINPVVPESCKQCPIGATCDGITLHGPPGSVWRPDARLGVFRLHSCPPGTQKINTSITAQECRPCRPGNQYILDPNRHSCQDCPSRQSCDGSQLLPTVDGSVWRPDMEQGVYVLESCPQGTGKQISSATAQECQPCAAGMECPHDNCTQCSACKPGKFKTQPSTGLCTVCPVNTFNPTMGATSEALCTSCPQGATTDATAQQSLSSCKCLPQYYMATHSDGSFECVPCPSGAICGDLSCSLANPGRQCGSSYREGETWIWTEADRFALVGCPPGSKLVNDTGHDNQECIPCPEGRYILKSNDPRAECIICPKSALCVNGLAPIFNPVEIEGQLVLGGSAISEDDLVQILKEVLGVEGDLQINQVGGGDRRSSVSTTISFTITADANSAGGVGESLNHPDFAQTLQQHIVSKNMTNTVISSVASQGKARDSSALIGTWEQQGGIYILTQCPLGTLLINASIENQECRSCPPLTYSFDPLDYCSDGVCESRSCTKCPVGAWCEGGSAFLPAVEGAKWQLTRITELTSSHMRLLECPAGYILIRREDSPGQDSCFRCPGGSYSISPSVWPSTLVTNTAENALTMCNECEEGADCTHGGADIQPTEGFWCIRNSTTGLCTARLTQEIMVGFESIKNGTKSEVAGFYQCPRGACGHGGNCTEGRVGPVCGVCQPEGNNSKWDGKYALSGSSCRKCSDADSDRESFRSMVAGAVLVFVLLWWYFAWRPVFSKPQTGIDAEDTSRSNLLWQKLKIFTDYLSTFSLCRFYLIPAKNYLVDKISRFVIWIITSDALDYSKIIISFAQVTSTFITNFNVDWPNLLEYSWQRLSFARMDFMMLPGPDCIAAEYTFLEKLQFFTIGTTFVSCLLCVPAAFAKGIFGSGDQRYIGAEQQLWFTVLFWLFLVYPTVSLQSTSGLSCQEVGADLLLKADYTEFCPTTNKRSMLFWWVTASILLFPIGIPLFLYGVIVSFKVNAMAKVMREDALAKAMVHTYKQLHGQRIASRLAKHVGSVPKQEGASTKNADALLRRAKEMYDGATEHDTIVLTARRLLEYLGSLGVRGRNDEEIEDLFMSYDDNGNGELEWDEFHVMIEELCKMENFITGHEILHTSKYCGCTVCSHETNDDHVAGLEVEQLRVLCKFKWSQLESDEDENVQGGLRGILKAEINRRNQEKLRAVGTSQRSLGKNFQRAPSGFSRVLSSATAASTVSCDPSEAAQELDDDVLDDVDTADRQKLVRWFINRANQLALAGVIALPVLRWNGERALERLALDRVGFLFSCYQVDFWYFELLEMGRKLLMTCIIVFAYDGSAEQLAIGTLITFSALLLFITLKPFTNWNLNLFQGVSLLTQALTLFYGLIVNTRKPPDENQVDNFFDVSTFVITYFNLFIFAIPVMAVIYARYYFIQQIIKKVWKRMKEKWISKRGHASDGGKRSELPPLSSRGSSHKTMNMVERAELGEVPREDPSINRSCSSHHLSAMSPLPSIAEPRDLCIEDTGEKKDDGFGPHPMCSNLDGAQTCKQISSTPPQPHLDPVMEPSGEPETAKDLGQHVPQEMQKEDQEAQEKEIPNTTKCLFCPFEGSVSYVLAHEKSCPFRPVSYEGTSFYV